MTISEYYKKVFDFTSGKTVSMLTNLEGEVHSSELVAKCLEHLCELSNADIIEEHYRYNNLKYFNAYLACFQSATMLEVKRRLDDNTLQDSDLVTESK